MARMILSAKFFFSLSLAVLLLLAGGSGSAVQSAGFGGFIENRGQLNGAVRLYALGARAAVYFTPGAVVLDLREETPLGARCDGRHDGGRDRLMHADGSEPPARRGCAVYVRFEGANPAPTIEAQGQVATRYNYFLGNDPSKWRADVPAFGEVVYHDLWPGVDLVYREEDGKLTYDIVSSPGADVSAVRFDYDGADRVVAGEGGLHVIQTSVGSIRDVRSLSDVGSSSLLLAREGSKAPGTPSLDRHNPAALLWSTFLGGSSSDQGHALALDPSGNAVVTGWTSSSGFPVTRGAYDPSYNGYYDGFVAKLGMPGVTDVATGSRGIRLVGLLPAVPNPFCQATEIRYSLAEEAEVGLAVFDVTGRRVTTLARGFMPSGDHRVSWDGQDESGERVAPGVYFVRCEIGSSTYYGRITRVR